MVEVAEHEQFEELAAGHALHALEPGDEQAFLSHLETCAECRYSLAEFSELAAGLAMSSNDELDAEPPAQLWDSIRQQVHADEDVVVVPMEQHRARRANRSRWLGAAAAVVLVAVGVVGWQLATGSGSSNTVQAALSSCRHATGCRVVQLTNARNANESAYLMISGQDVRVATKSLPAIDPSRQTYVLWQMPQDGRPAGVVAFPLSADHNATVARGTLPQPYDSTTAFAISRESGTGIPARPSTPVVIGAATSA
jgi:anti-sigma-K factor RskA